MKTDAPTELPSSIQEREARKNGLKRARKSPWKDIFTSTPRYWKTSKMLEMVGKTVYVEERIWVWQRCKKDNVM